MDTMKWKKWGKVLLAIIAAIFIGAISSGVWNHVLGPSITWSRDKILTIATLGMQTYKDSTYQKIACGFREHASHLLFSEFTYWVTCGLVILGLFMIMRSHSVKGKIEEITSRIDRLKKGKKEKTMLPEDLRKKASSLRIKSIWTIRLSYFVFVVVIFVAISSMINVTRLNYVNSSISHFQQVLAICSPYLKPEKEKRILSSFAQIRSRKDYVNILNELTEIAKTDNLYMPKFNIW